MSAVLTVDTEGVARAKTLFESTFSLTPTVAVAAPGRVNLIGEHVDYNDGFVFPLALEKNTYIVGAISKGDECAVAAEAFPGVIARFSPGDSHAAEDLVGWAKYLKGMTALYARKGYEVKPFMATVVSDVPLGSGLSSSASLEMATALLIEQLGGFETDPFERALMGQACEHEFVGVPCGIMDQLISSRGEAGRALLIDCRNLEVTPVPLQDPEVVIVVANSRVAHELSGSEYPSRRKQCAEAAKIMAQKYSDKKITHLRDCNMDMLNSVMEELDEKTVKRAKHAIEEDLRTLEAKKCLEAGDLKRCGELMYKSHASLRDLFEVSTKEVDALVEIARSIEGVYGSRITGGGFGGCTVTLVRKGSVDALLKAFEDRYPSASGGLEAAVFATRAGSGARVLNEILNA